MGALTLALRDRARRFEDDSDACIRGVIATEVYRDMPGLPVVRKRAEIIALCLERLLPTVLPEDRIITPVWRRRRVHQGISNPDYWRTQVAFPERHGCSEEWPIPKTVKDVLRWWNEHGTVRRENRAREKHGCLGRYAIARPHGWLGGHTLPDHSILLQAGIDGLRSGVRGALEEEKDAGKRDQFLAMDRCLEGLSRHALRCAVAARDKAAAVTDPQLRQRLVQAAENCELVAHEKPRTFPQALQLIRFSHLADQLDNPGDASSYARIDLYLLPFYEADIAAGRLNETEAFDWVCHFLIKNWHMQGSENMCVGGLTRDGKDATNALSFMFLEAMESTELPSDLSVRMHSGCSADFLRAVARSVRLGYGRPSLFNDDVTVEALVRKGVAPGDAHDYAPLGCVEVMLPGRSAYRTMGMQLNLPKVLELVLNGGRCLVTGDVVWDDVPDEFGSFDELFRAYHGRVQSTVTAAAEIIREDERIEPECFPRPWLTVLSHGGTEDGRDITGGQPKYDPVGVTLQGVADVSNSLYVVKRLVFEEERVSLSELRQILSDDWEGYEALRQEVISGMPRFGQGCEEVDLFARTEASHYASCFEGERTQYGGRFWPMIFGVTTGMLHGAVPMTGAMPSGRRRGEMLAASLQPSPVGERGAPTELLGSVAAIDFTDFPGGVSNVQDMDPSHFRGEAGLDMLVALITGFWVQGGMELSLNMLDEKTLRKAQTNPDDYNHLMVRIFGLSARFVCLEEDLQNVIIDRIVAAGGAD